MSQTLPPALQDAMTVGQKLVELCQQGKFRQAIEDLYADDATHVECMDCGEAMPQMTAGKDNILQMSDQWEKAHEVHGAEVKGPYPHDSGKFSAWMWMDVTGKEGPMAGQRMQMEEVCLYHLEGGKIAKVEFMWDPTPMMGG
jgi:hypothetical protein